MSDDDYSSYRFNECAEARHDCLASECCQDEGYACFKKPHTQYAQCRPLGAREACEDTDEWRCPGWADCPEDYESCYDAKCCKGHQVGCFKRANRQFAQCRKFEGKKEECVSDGEWLCPGTWETCSPTMGACKETRCCDHADHRCYAKTAGYAQCLPVGSCEGKVGADGAAWSCDELLPLPPPPPAAGAAGGGGGGGGGTAVAGVLLTLALLCVGGGGAMWWRYVWRGGHAGRAAARQRGREERQDLGLAADEQGEVSTSSTKAAASSKGGGAAASKGGGRKKRSKRRGAVELDDDDDDDDAEELEEARPAAPRRGGGGRGDLVAPRSKLAEARAAKDDDAAMDWM